MVSRTFRDLIICEAQVLVESAKTRGDTGPHGQSLLKVWLSQKKGELSAARPDGRSILLAVRA